MNGICDWKGKELPMNESDVDEITVWTIETHDCEYVVRDYHDAVKQAHDFIESAMDGYDDVPITIVIKTSKMRLEDYETINEDV